MKYRELILYIKHAARALDGKLSVFSLSFTKPYSNTIVPSAFWFGLQPHMHTLAQIEWLNVCFSLFIDCCSVYWAVLNSWGTLKTKKHLWMDGEYVTWHGPCEKRHTPLGRSSTTKPCCPSVVQTPPRRHKTEWYWQFIVSIQYTPLTITTKNRTDKNLYLFNFNQQRYQFANQQLYWLLITGSANNNELCRFSCTLPFKSLG